MPASARYVVLKPDQDSFDSFRDEVLEALSRQRSRFEVAVTKKRRAREAADLLLLSLYCHIPPSRGLEIRTLEMLNQEEPFKAADFRTKNIVLLRRSGPVTIHIQVYKTRRFTGHEQIELEVSRFAFGWGLMTAIFKANSFVFNRSQSVSAKDKCTFFAVD